MQLTRLNSDTLIFYRELNLDLIKADLKEFNNGHRRTKVSRIFVRDKYQAKAVRAKLFRAHRNSLAVGI